MVSYINLSAVNKHRPQCDQCRLYL